MNYCEGYTLHSSILHNPQHISNPPNVGRRHSAQTHFEPLQLPSQSIQNNPMRNPYPFPDNFIYQLRHMQQPRNTSHHYQSQNVTEIRRLNRCNSSEVQSEPFVTRVLGEDDSDGM